MPSLNPKPLRRLLALLLALSLFAPGSSFGQVLYSCIMSGKVSGACCCQRAKQRQLALERARGVSPAAKAERPDCCKVEDHRRSAVPSLIDDPARQVASAALSEVLPIVVPDRLVAERASVRAKQIRGPPRGAPLFARNCVFLI